MPSTFLILFNKQGYENLTKNRKIENSRCAQEDVEPGNTVLFYFAGKVPEHPMSLACCAPVQSVSSDKTVIRFGNIERFPSPIPLDRIRELVANKELEEAFERCGQQGFRIIRLQPDSLPRVRMEVERQAARGMSADTQERTIPLAEDAYFRETGRRKEKILRLHNALSNSFVNWLKLKGYTNVLQEQRGVDVEFTSRSHLCRAELKVCHAVGTTKVIREALGQLLEYNYFGNRVPAKRWYIILDERPSSEDQTYVDKLHSELGLPVVLGWQEDEDFQLLERI